MVSRIHSCVLYGIEGIPVEIETHICNGMPSYNIVGLPSQVIRESKDRVRSAIKNCNIKFPDQRITQNMSPAHIKKEGSHLDLPIALGILSGSTPEIAAKLETFAVVGELSLEGQIKPVKGILSLIDGLKSNGFTQLIIPEANFEEAKHIEGVAYYTYSHLIVLIEDIHHSELTPKVRQREYKEHQTIYPFDFKDIKGQENIVRAMEIAAAGFFNVLMIGPPGCGKSMIAERMVTILPDLNMSEKIELTKIYSISDENKCNQLIHERPVRSPHHSITSAALLGGGNKMSPGEISKAHQGVLILDELPEFRKEVIESLREPMSGGVVHVVKNNKSAVFPARFLLLATMNPCACGYHISSAQSCQCNVNEIKRYLSKLSGPILDRMDMHLYLDRVDIDENKKQLNLDSESIKKRVENAVEFREMRNQRIPNAHLSKKDLLKWCKLSDETKKRLDFFYKNGKISMRSYDKIIKLSRTIADLEQSENINTSHILEATLLLNINRLKENL